MERFQKISFILILTVLAFSQVHPANLDLNTAISNQQDGLAIPYRPGVDYDRLKLNDYGSVQSLFPSSSVSIKAQGTPGQLSTVSLDGGPAPHTAIALDGMPIETAQVTPLDISILPTEFFQSADIYKNNVGTFGYSGSSGMINFNLYKPGMSANEIQFYGGSYGSFGGKVIVSQSVSELDYLIGASFSSASNNFTYTDSWDESRTAVNSDFTKYSFISKFAVRYMKLDMTYTSKEAGTGTGSARQNDDLFTANTGFKKDGFQTELSYINWMNRYRDTAYSLDDSHLNQTIGFNLGGDMGWDFYRIKPRLNNKLFLVNSTKVGNRSDDEIGLVLENVFLFGPLDLNLTLNQVYRISRGYIPVPALDTTFKVFENIRLIGSVSRCFRYPTFNDLYWPEDSFSRGNAGLKPEDGLAWKTGMVVLFYPFYASVTYSESYLYDLIVWMPDTTGKWAPQNIYRTRSRVFSLSGNLETRFEKLVLKANASFSLNHSINDDPDSAYYQKRLTYVPLYKTAFNLNAEFDQWIGFNMLFRQVSERFTTEANSVWLTPYYVMDVKLNLFFAFVSVENIFDAQFQEIQGYPQPGRTFRAGIDWKI